MSVRIQFEPRDLWIGVYWTVERAAGPQSWWRVYVCIVPTLPIIFAWWRGPKVGEGSGG